MKKVLLFAATAALVLAGCSENSLFEEAQKAKDLGTPIQFGTYLGNGVGTRAAANGGTAGSLTTEKLQGADYGFGVFAYYTGTDNYETIRTTAKPNYMFNERVYWNASAWKYDIVKYWPNGNNPADNDGAEGDPASSKISFFAYAPYAPAVGTTGITKLPVNTGTGDPVVGYKLAADGKTVDLLWGSAPADKSYQTALSTPATITVKKVETDALAPVNLNIQKLKTGEKIAFLFKHALAKVGGSLEQDETPGSATGGLQIKLDIDKADGFVDDLGAETRVTVKEISIVNNGDEDLGGGDYKAGNSVIFSTGELNLATGVFQTDLTGETTTINHTIKNDATGSAELATAIAEPTTAWAVTDFDNAALTGVTTTAQNVYKDETNPMVFLPGTKPSFKISVTYYIRTKDDKLADGFSVAEQKITKKVALTTPVEQNKKYNLILRLGLTSIKFDATVENWTKDQEVVGTDPITGDPIYGDKDTPVTLPINVE